MPLTPEGAVAQACYAMGYNLAIEYLADYEKTWMLDSFRSLNQRVLQAQDRPLTEWLFLEVGSFCFTCQKVAASSSSSVSGIMAR